MAADRDRYLPDSDVTVINAIQDAGATLTHRVTPDAGHELTGGDLVTAVGWLRAVFADESIHG